MGTIRRKLIGGTTAVRGGGDSLGLLPLEGECGRADKGIRIVRLISHAPLNARSAAQAIVKASKYVKEFDAQLLVTPAGFGEAVIEPSGTAEQAVQRYVYQFLGSVQSTCDFGIILGVDSQGGLVQDAYFLPCAPCSFDECKRVWKSYPRSDEMHLLTKGKPCKGRAVSVGKDKISLLVCHDLAAFSGRSCSNRGQQRERWAKQIYSEVTRGPNAGVVHLVHYWDTPSQGRVFLDGMAFLIKNGVAYGVSTFRTKLDPTLHAKQLRQIRERTSKYAGPTLDLYVTTC